MKRLILILMLITLCFAVDLTDEEKQNIRENWSRYDVDRDTLRYENNSGEKIGVIINKGIDEITYTKYESGKVIADTTYTQSYSVSAADYEKVIGYIPPKIEGTWVEDKLGVVIEGKKLDTKVIKK